MTTEYEAICYLLDGAARKMFEETKGSGYEETKAAEDRYVATVVSHLRRGADSDAAASTALAEMVAGAVRRISHYTSADAETRAAGTLVADIQAQGRASDALEELVRSEIDERYWELINDWLREVS